MKKGASKWLIIITSILLIGLLVNQVFYALDAAEKQEHGLNEKVEIALDVIVDKVSANQSVCKSVDQCLNMEQKMQCCKYLNEEKEWKTIDSIIQTELARFKIDLNYNFDFCKDQPDDKNTYAMHMNKVFQGSGIVMYLEFPERSKYLLKQMGSVFFSSILLILFISVAYVITYRYYKRERKLVNRTKDFINNMTHEFKTPLANISFANNMIDRENQTLNSEKIVRYTQIISEENKRLVDNCEDLLLIGSAESDISCVMGEKVDVNILLDKIISRFSSFSNMTSLSIDQYLKASKSIVEGKESFLDNVFSNLIDNGIKYADGDPRLVINTYNDGDNVVVEIKDKGIGISKADQKEVFEKFYRVANQDQHDIKGFGLGLSYVKMVVEQMKGKVDLESEIGQGSIFIVKLPLSNG